MQVDRQRDGGYAISSILALLFTFSLLGPASAHAVDLIAINGQGDGVAVTAFAIRTGKHPDLVRGSWTYDFSREWQVGVWRAEGPGAREPHIVDVSFTPVITVRPSTGQLRAAFLELGFGFHLLSHCDFGDVRNFGSSFQFGELLGIGVNGGSSDRYSVALRVQHVSNGGIKKTNDGVTFGQVLFRYRF